MAYWNNEKVMFQVCAAPNDAPALSQATAVYFSATQQSIA